MRIFISLFNFSSFTGIWGVNDRDYMGNTPLHYAAANDRPEAARMLIKWGADVSAETRLSSAYQPKNYLNAIMKNVGKITPMAVTKLSKVLSQPVTPRYKISFLFNTE